ncbi:MAG: hypothetical protein U0T02_10665 [Solirubrobacteraceae bacterium]
MASRQRPRDAADAVRSAVDRTVNATVGGASVTRERAQDLVDEVAQAAGRVREVIDDLRLATGEDLRAFHDDLAALERRVAALEKALAGSCPGGGARKAGRSGAKTAKRGAETAKRGTKTAQGGGRAAAAANAKSRKSTSARQGARRGS